MAYGRPKRQHKPTSRYVVWYVLKMLTASRDREVSMKTGNTKVVEWLVHTLDDVSTHTDVVGGESVEEPAVHDAVGGDSVEEPAMHRDDGILPQIEMTMHTGVVGGESADSSAEDHRAITRRSCLTREERLKRRRRISLRRKMLSQAAQ